jgi:hypothetical protein
LVEFVQSNARYAATSVASTPAFVCSVVWSSVPWDGVFKKSLQLYATPATSMMRAVPESSRYRNGVFIVFPSLNKTIR